MSNLLSQASLVMIPSGYKEDVVYSPVPTDGSGDLAFTRASNGTRVNSAGLVEVCPWNLIPNSEVFALWNKVEISNTITVTDNFVTAPNGTLTAAKVVFATFDGTGQIFQNYTVDPTQNFTATLYAKVPSGTKQCWFGFFDGSIKTQLKTLTTEWQRIEYTGSITAGGVRACWFYGEGSASNVEVHLWGGQLNVGTAKPYFPTTDRLNVPRLTYQNGGGGCPSLLLEKQSTNLVSYSQDFTNSYWSKLGQGSGDVAVVTANYAISPDGTQNATRFVCNLNGGTTASSRSWMIANFTPQATSTISIWIKLNSAGTKTVLLSDSGGGTKTISGTDWQRIDATFVGAGGEFRIGLIGGSTSDTLDCCIWGAQAESGSYPTSYIPTTSSSATRVADACFKTGISSLIGQTEGVVFLDAIFPDVNTGQVFMELTGSGNDVNFQISGTTLYFYSATNWSISTTISANTRYKMAGAYKGNDIVFYVNGVQIGADSVATISAKSNLYVNTLSTGAYLTPMQINEVILFPTRLTNAELASLTTI